MEYVIRSNTLNMKSPLIVVGEDDYRKDYALLELVRCGGEWSLHDPNDTDDSEPLLDGEANWIPETEDAYGRWDKPNEKDFETALSRIKEA